MSCAKQTVIAIIRKGDKFWVGSNACRNPQDKCPREGIASGSGYELCEEVCKQICHAEVDACIRAGKEAEGGDLYLIGHTYACDGCMHVMREHRIRNLYVVSDLRIEVSKDYCCGAKGACSEFANCECNNESAQ